MNYPQAATAEAEPTSRFAQIGGLKLHYLDWGGDAARRTILLVHGGSAHAHWWDFVAPQLTGFGRVLALDFRGHGRSEWPRPPLYGPQAHIGDLRTFVAEHLGARVVLAGHSMGGEIAVRVAAHHAELVEALISIDAPPGGPPLTTRLKWRWKRRKQGGPRPEFKSAEELLRRFRLSPPGHRLTPEALEALALKGAEQLPNGNWAFRFDPGTRAWPHKRRDWGRPRLSRLAMPVLILRGADSALMSPRAAQKMNRAIRGSILKEIPHAHHHVPLDNPDATAAAMADFLSSPQASAQPRTGGGGRTDAG